MIIYQGSLINNFLGQNGQQYKIPVYQRNYEWSWEQCDKLFEDIVIAAKRNQLHFCGSIVFQPMTPLKGINNSIIIDGQQRLTTIYILIKALYDCAKDDADRMMPSLALFNNDQFNQFQLDDTSKLKLKAAKDNNEQLLKLLYDKSNELDKNCEIYRNYNHFCDLIKKEQGNGYSVSDIYRGISLLTVAVIQLDNNDKAQEIFERINSAGVPLALSDKIRNFVLMTDVNQDKLYDDYWIKLERLLGRDLLGNFFMDYLNMKIDGFTKESSAYEEFKRLYDNNGYTNESMLQELLHYAEQYHTFFYGNVDLGEEVNRALKGMRQLNQTTCFLFLFRIFDDYEAKIINLEELGKILNFLLNYSIRRLVCEIGSNSLRGLYKTLYYRVFNQGVNKSHYYDSIVSFFMQMTTKDAIPADNEFKLALKERNLYRKNALCKYLLVALENQGKEKVNIDSLSIEHILPQNKKLSLSWQQMLGDNWEEVRDKYLHTLGNLTLTGYNSELGDLPFYDKKKKLASEVTHVTVLYNDVNNEVKWDAHAIERRAENLADQIIALFPIELPEKVIEFIDSRYHNYTATNPKDATHKTVKGYELLGEQVNTDSFASMVRSVARKLYKSDSSIIDVLARNNEPITTWSTPIFSFDKGVVKNPVKLVDDADIYISTGYSASECIGIIKWLLCKYGLDVNEDFSYSAKLSKQIDDSKCIAELQNYLENCNQDTLTLTLKDVEKIIGKELPNSAYKHGDFWSADGESHKIANSIVNAGYKVIKKEKDSNKRIVSVKLEKVTE